MLHALDDFVPVQWDKGFVFLSYISREKIYEKIGHRWRNGILEHSSENNYTMVFMLGDEVVYDVQGPREGVGFYNFETEVEVDKETRILSYPTGGVNPSGTFFVIVPEAIASAIKQKPVETAPFEQFGKWTISRQQDEFLGEMVMTKEGVIHIKARVEPGYYAHFWAFLENSGAVLTDEDIPVVAHANLAKLEFEDVTIKFIESRDDNITVMLSLVYQGEHKRFILPFEKVAE